MQNEYWAGSVNKKVTLAKLKYAAKALEPGLVVTKRSPALQARNYNPLLWLHWLK